MREQIPAEFEWIKPGVKATCQKSQRNLIIKKPPHQAHECYEITDWFVLWECYGTVGGSKCADLIPGHHAPITLTMTREQAEFVLSRIKPPVEILPPKEIEPLIKQIEEKLNGL